MKLLKDAKPYVPSVPTEEDWGDYKSDLDQNYAHSVFAGRTNQEMQRSFWENVLERTSDLRWMPDVPFRYYMLGFRDFVMAKDFDCYGSDAASCFLGLILEKVENHPLAIIPIVQDLLPAAEYVAEHQAEFEADVEIYGNFSDKFAKIKMLFAKQRIL